VFQSQQPLVMLDGAVLAKTGSPSDSAVLVTAAGVRHSLGLLGTLDKIWKTALRRMLPDAEAILQAELPRQVAELRTDPLSYFAEYLVAAFHQREYSEESYHNQPSVPEPKHVDWTTEVAQTAKQIPSPESIQPSLWIFGRVWRLRESVARDGCWQLRTKGKSYALSGDFLVVNTLIENWRNEVAKYISEVAGRLACDVKEVTCMINARDELRSQGFVERSDLIFLPGKPPRLGHIVPAHYNRTLGRNCRRDLAVTAPFGLPPTSTPSRSSLKVYEKSSRKWKAARLPNGLCLGPDPPKHPQDSPGVGLASFLRWAGQRIAGNGVFHSSDDTDTASDDPYEYGY
jgi:hypothetical protein